MPAYKLQGKLDFQGLPISIENRKGSVRHWYDVDEEKEGTTKMKFPYGYVRGTMGLDGDAVDVYVGNDKTSTKVFVITQNKAPDFKKVDEQKVMLGFDSPEKAKLAYLAHMNKPGFFRDMKEMSVSEFMDKLVTQKGKLIKGALITDTVSDKMGDTVGTMGIQRKKDKSMTTASEELDKVSKALTARMVSGIASRQRIQEAAAAHDAAAAAPDAPVATPSVFQSEPVEVPSHVGIEGTMDSMGTERQRPMAEPPVVPVRAINNDLTPVPQEPEVFKACTGCGRMNKSMTECLTCDAAGPSDATPIWTR